jgi:hypothetical protein
MAWNPIRISGLLLTFALLAICTGCQESSKPDQPKSSAGATFNTSIIKADEKADTKKTESKSAETSKHQESAIAKKDNKAVQKPAVTPWTPPSSIIPKIVLTDSLRATCLVNVGDVMPDGELTTIDGGKVSIQSQYDDRLTVIFFWWEGGSNYARLSADSAMKDLQTDLAEPYADKGVKVIGVNLGDKPQVVQQDLERIGVKISCYFDPDQAYFHKVATGILPRIYLLDAAGRILWFDTDYSQITRRNLVHVVRILLGEK